MTWLICAISAPKATKADATRSASALVLLCRKRPVSVSSPV